MSSASTEELPQKGGRTRTFASLDTMILNPGLTTGWVWCKETTTYVAERDPGYACTSSHGGSCYHLGFRFPSGFKTIPVPFENKIYPVSRYYMRMSVSAGGHGTCAEKIDLSSFDITPSVFLGRPHLPPISVPQLYIPPQQALLESHQNVRPKCDQ